MIHIIYGYPRLLTCITLCPCRPQQQGQIGALAALRCAAWPLLAAPTHALSASRAVFSFFFTRSYDWEEGHRFRNWVATCASEQRRCPACPGCLPTARGDL